MKVEVDYECCEANGICEGFAPEVFELDEQDNLNIRSQPTAENLDQVRQAVRSCPKGALTLHEE